MFEQELTYQKLQIPSLEIYEAMGYKDSMPDGMVIEEINTLLDRTTPLLRPRFFFFIADGLDCQGIYNGHMDHIAEISGQEDHRQRGDNVGTVGSNDRAEQTEDTDW